jgi:hypothetical protein
MHEQLEPTEEEQEQAPERVLDEEPDRDQRSAEEAENEEPIHDA